MIRQKIIAAVLLLLLCNAALCTNNCKPKDCYDLRCYRRSLGMDGPHIVYPGIAALPYTLTMVCDQISDNGAWQVIMRRDLLYNFTNFNVSFENFRSGVGEQYGGRSEFYLGHELIHLITTNYPDKCAEIRIEAMSYDGDTMGLSAKNFSMGDQQSGYKWYCGDEFNAYNADTSTLRVYDQRPFSLGNTHCRPLFGNQPWWFVPNTTCTKFYAFGTNIADYHTLRHKKHVWVNFEGGGPVIARWIRIGIRPYKQIRVCNNPCLNGGTCMYEPVTDTHRCICHSKYCGLHCEKAKSDCKNGGICVYIGVTDPPFCKCPHTHCGPNCEISNPCNNSGICEVKNGNVLCICPPGLYGDRCEVVSKCKNGGTITFDSADGTSQCTCPSTHCGDTCEKIDCDFKSDPCKASPCKNGGSCRYNKDANMFSCECAPHYKGPTCRSKKKKKHPVILYQQNDSYGTYLYIPILLLLAMVVVGFIALMVKKHRDAELEKQHRLLQDDQTNMEEEEAGLFGYLGF